MKKRTIAVIDLKAFYSYVECIDRGLDPFTTPLIVADKERSVNTIVLSVTPYLKSKGVPSRLRVKELPSGFDYIFATPRMERYIEKSGEVVGILLDFVSPDDIHVYSIDEAFLDLTSYLDYYKKTPMELVEMIIQEITNRTGLMATGGIGDNFFLAKVALDLFAKKEKNGIATMHIEEVEERLWPITPLNKIWGIGRQTEAKLNRLGMYCVGDVARQEKEYLQGLMGVMGEQLWNHCHGIDEADIHEEYVPESTSLSLGQTLAKDYNKIEIVTIIREMCDDLSSRLRSINKKTSVVSLYIGYSKATGGFARQMSLLSSTDDTPTLFNALMEIFKKYIEDKPIRNIGLNFGKLTDCSGQQLSLFESEVEQKENHELQLTIDEIHNKYGKNMILRASALSEESTAKERHNQIGGHRK